MYARFMSDKPRCQSCGMPLGTPGFYGSNIDGSENQEWCRFCYQQGEFTEPNLSADEMVQRSIDYMVASLKFERGEAEKMSREVIPGLRRWTTA